MTVRQAGAPITDQEFKLAARQGGDKLIGELFRPDNKDGPHSFKDAKCRLYPKLSFFFDGTNNNLDRDTPLNRLSNVAKLYRTAVDDRQRRGASPTYIPGVGTPFKIRKIMGYTDTLGDDQGGPALHLDWGAELAIPPEVERCVHYVAAHEVSDPRGIHCDQSSYLADTRGIRQPGNAAAT